MLFAILTLLTFYKMVLRLIDLKVTDKCCFPSLVMQRFSVQSTKSLPWLSLTPSAFAKGQWSDLKSSNACDEQRHSLCFPGSLNIQYLIVFKTTLATFYTFCNYWDAKKKNSWIKKQGRMHGLSRMHCNVVWLHGWKHILFSNVILSANRHEVWKYYCWWRKNCNWSAVCMYRLTGILFRFARQIQSKSLNLD